MADNFYSRYSGVEDGTTSVNGITGDVTIAAGTNIGIVTAGQTITVSAGASVLTTIGTIDSQTKSANALVAIANILYAQTADTTHPGMMSTGTQSLAGNKTFTGTISASNLSGTNTGDVTIGTANGLSLAAQVLSLTTASTSTTGALTSTDWNTFNNKQSALSFGDLTDAGTDGITVTGGTGAVIGSGTSLSQHVADTSHNGYLSSTDWNTFNGKQSTITIGALDAQAENAAGLALVSNVLSTQSADATHPGMVNTTTQTFAGAKTFSSAPNLSSLTASTALVLDSSNNVASLVYTALNTNSTIAARDIYGNSYFNSVNGGSTAIVTSGQTVNMNAGSTQIQKTTGTLTATFILPDATTLINGNTYYFNNNSTGTVTIQHFGGGALTTVLGGGYMIVICTDNSTQVGTWDFHSGLPSNSSWGSSALTIGGTVAATNLSGTNTGDVTLAAVGSSPSANAASLSGQVLTLQPFDGTHPGVAPLSGGGTTNFLRADGTWNVPPGSATANPAWGYVSQSSTLNPAVISTYYKLSGASFTITLPDATTAGYAGQTIRFYHNGTNLVANYTFNTTSSQHMNYNGTAIASGSVVAYTIGEFFEFQSNGVDWDITEHRCDTSWIAADAPEQFITYTISSGSATLAATYVPALVYTVTAANATAAATYVQAYTFTITAGNTAAIGAVYSNNGHNYTLVQTLLVGDTTAVFTGAASPSASGTLTYVSGTHTGGNITYSAVTGGDSATTYTIAATIAGATTLVTTGSAVPGSSGKLAKTGGTGDAIITYSAVTGDSNGHTWTVAQTVASGVTLITQGTAAPQASGKLVKTGGSGDAVITFSSYTGSTQTIGATTTAPIWYGSPIINAYQFRRWGDEVEVWWQTAQSSAGVVGSGDYIFPTPRISGVNYLPIDTTVQPVRTGGTPQTNQISDQTVTQFKLPMIGLAIDTTAVPIGLPYFWIPYDSGSYRVYAVFSNSGSFSPGLSPGSSTFSAASAAVGYAWQLKYKVQGWLP